MHTVCYVVLSAVGRNKPAQFRLGSVSAPELRKLIPAYTPLRSAHGYMLTGPADLAIRGSLPN